MTAYFNKVKRYARVHSLLLVFLGFVGGISSPAFGDPAEAKSASPVSSSSAPPDQGALLLDATQNLVQALVKSVQQASSQPAAPAGLAATPLLQHGPEANRETAEQSLPAVPWTVPRGAQLQTVLTDWCHRAGWTLVWQSEYSYRVEADASFDGDFVSAVTAMFSAMKNVSPAIYPDIYKGNRVVVVKNDPTR